MCAYSPVHFHKTEFLDFKADKQTHANGNIPLQMNDQEAILAFVPKGVTYGRKKGSRIFSELELKN